jgi:hypothetical protein
LLFPWNIVASPNFSHNHNVFFSTRYRGVWRSEDSGAHWTNIWDTSGWVDSLVISPAFISDGTLYAFIREEGIYKSEDRGKTWSLIHKADRSLTALAISPDYQKDGTVFASGTGGLIKTLDRGRNWQKISGFCCDESGADVAAIALSPNYANDGTVLVSVTGKGLYKSVNGGTEFIETGADLIDGNHLLRTLAFSPNYAQDNIIIGASNESLFRSQDGGASWERLARPIRYEENNDYVRYRGQWESAESEKSSARQVSYSGVAGDKVSLDFVGSEVRWIGSKSDHHGIGKIYIDGLLKGNADLFSDSNVFNTTVFSIENLPDTHHTVTIEVAGIKNPKSSGYRVDIDAFEVIH